MAKTDKWTAASQRRSAQTDEKDGRIDSGAVAVVYVACLGGRRLDSQRQGVEDVGRPYHDKIYALDTALRATTQAFSPTPMPMVLAASPTPFRYLAKTSRKLLAAASLACPGMTTTATMEHPNPPKSPYQQVRVLTV